MSAAEVLLKQSEQFSQETTYISDDQSKFKVYKIRWFLVFILSMCNACLMFHYLHYSIIANIVVEFYEVSYEAVDWTAMIMLVLYPPTIIPVMYTVNRIGLRRSVLIAMIGVSAASWIKVGSAAPDRFWMALTGQGIIAVVQAFIMVLPAQFSTAWFAEEQMGLACGVVVLGIQVGYMLGSYLPTIQVHYSKDKDAVAHEMSMFHIGTAIVCTAICVLVFAVFRSEPPTPPSKTQKQLEVMGKLNFKESTIWLFKNTSYVLYLVGNALSISVSQSVGVLMNQIILQYYPDATEEVGRIMAVSNIIALPSIVGGGYILTKFQRYRLTTISIFVLYLLGGVMFTLAPLYSLPAVYVATTVLTVFMTTAVAIIPVVAAELTYPVPESISFGYIFASGQLTGIASIYVYSFLLYKFGAIWCNTAICGQILISTILIISMKFTRKRQTADEFHNGHLPTLKI